MVRELTSDEREQMNGHLDRIISSINEMRTEKTENSIYRLEYFASLIRGQASVISDKCNKIIKEAKNG